MPDKFLCVLAGYDSEAEARLSSFQNSLYEAGFSGTQTKNIPMHITVGRFPVEEEDRAAELVRSAAAHTQPFELSLSHTGIFAGSKVLFVAPDGKRELLALREYFGASHGWVPHTTMLIDQPDTIYQALPVLMDVFVPSCGQITCLHLYEFFPPRHILTVELGKAPDTEQEEKR